MRENLFRHVNVKGENVHIPNGLAKDAKAECARYDEIICRSGGIDMQVLGIGHNGHIHPIICDIGTFPVDFM